MTSFPQLPQFDVFCPAVCQDPYTTYASLRSLAPVYYDASHNVWIVSRYAEAAIVLRNHDEFSTRLASFESSLLGAEGEAHARLRRTVSRVFAPARMSELERRIHTLAREMVGRMVERGRGELMEELSHPLPMRVIGEMLDIAPEHLAACRLWSHAITVACSPFLTAAERATAKVRIGECRAFFVKHVLRALAGELNGIFPDLLSPQEGYHRLTPDELIDVCILILVAGNETTTNLIGNAAQLLLSRPEVMGQLRQDTGLIPSFVEEVLRFDSPVQRVTRVTRVPVELAGYRIPQDSQILVLIGSANRDEERFPQADEFRLDRTFKGHISFGLGPHFCLGLHLARIETVTVLKCLLQSAELAMGRAGEPIVYRKFLDLRGPQRLDVFFQRATYDTLPKRKIRVLHFGPATTDYPYGPRKLVKVPAFASAYRLASEIVESSLGWSPWKTMHEDETPIGITKFENYLVRECLFQLSLFQAHCEAGLMFDFVLALSVGEIAAAHAAGITTFEEAVQICCAVSHAFRVSPPGDLAVIMVSPENLRPHLDTWCGEIYFAIDTKTQTVLGVRTEQVPELRQLINRAGYAIKFLEFQCMPHTIVTNRAHLEERIKELPPRLPLVRYFSTVTGCEVTTASGVNFWGRLVTEPALWIGALNALLDESFDEIMRFGTVRFESDLTVMLNEQNRDVPISDGAEALLGHSERP